MGFLDATGITTLVTKAKEYFALRSELNGKQDTLKSGINIKTVGGNSLLGAGNISFPSSPTALPSYQIRRDGSSFSASDSCASYRIALTAANGDKWVPINTSSSSSDATIKTLNTRPIDPFGQIIYVQESMSQGRKPTPNKCWLQYIFMLGYSYVISSPSAYTAVYLKCSPQANGSAIMNSLTQSLPSSNDGFIYIFLGNTTSVSSQIELVLDHPVYYHDGTGIRLWTGAASGGASRLTLYVQRRTAGQTLYADSSCTTPFIEACDWDYREAYNRLKSADIVEIRWIESTSAGHDFFCSSIYRDFADDTINVCSVDTTGAVYFVV